MSRVLPRICRRDDRDKSKDSKKSVSINKLKCINTNLNINGNNTGDVNLGNKGQGYLGANSYGSGYYDGYGNKQGKGFDCVINNNNTNTNINLGVGGNQTTPDLACEECFGVNSTLQTEIIEALVEFNGSLSTSDGESILAIGPGTDTIEQLCDIIESSTEFYGAPISTMQLDEALSFILTGEFDVDVPALDALIECLLEAGVIVHRELPPPPPMSISDNGIADVNIECTGDPICESLLQARLTNSNSLGSTNINTDTSEFQGTADSPIIAQGTGDSSALAKLEKSKQQWIELLP